MTEPTKDDPNLAFDMALYTAVLAVIYELAKAGLVKPEAVAARMETMAAGLSESPMTARFVGQMTGLMRMIPEASNDGD